MKKILVLFIVLLTGTAYAANTTYILMQNKRTVGPGTTKTVNNAYDSWGCDVLTFGNMSAVTIRIEGNQGGTIFDPEGMQTHTMTFANHSSQLKAGIGSFEITSHVVKQIRGYLVSLSGGVDPRATVRCTGKE